MTGFRVLVECECCGGEGFTSHDCGEDSCCCLAPEDNVRCWACRGTGSIEVEDPTADPGEDDGGGQVTGI